MDKRTKKAIIQAFNDLIERYEFEDITIQMICKKAEVSKATFYRYFRDKYDVMNENYKTLLDYYSGSGQSHDYYSLYLNLFNAGKEHLIKTRKSFKTIGINSFRHFIFRYSYDLLIHITEQNRNGDGLTQQEILQCDVFCHGVSYMYEDWISGKYDLTGEEAASLLYNMMPDSLKYRW